MPVRFIIVLHFFVMTGVHAVRTLLTLYSIQLGASPFTIGVLATSFGLIPILFSWISGRLADRFGSRWLMLLGTTATACGMLLPYFVPSVAVIIVAGILTGLTTSTCNVSLQTLVGLLSTPQNRARNYSNFSLAGSLTTFAGPLYSGFIIDLAGYASTCLCVAALVMVPVVMLALRGARLPRGSGVAAPSGSLRQMLAVPGVWRALAASGIGQTGGDLFQFYMPVYASAAGLTPSAIGMLLATYALAAFTARWFLPQLVAKSSAEIVLAYAFGVGGLAFVLLPFCHTAVTIALASFLTGVGLGFARPISMMLMFAYSPQGRSGEAMGLRLTAENVTRLVGPMLFGLVASVAGLASVFWLNAVMLGAGGALMHAGGRGKEKSAT